MAWTLTGTRSGSSTQAAASGTAPSGATDGLNVADVQSVTVTVSAVAAQTLSGAGALQAYTYSASVARWARCEDLDLTVGSGASGSRDYSWATVIVPNSVGRLYYMPSGVTISGGTNVVIQVDCYPESSAP